MNLSSYNPHLSGNEHQEPGRDIELYFCATNLPRRDIDSASDPICIVYQRVPGANAYAADAYKEIGRTKRINDNENPIWKEGIHIRFTPQRIQELLIVLIDDDDNGLRYDHLGQVRVLLSELVKETDDYPVSLPLRFSKLKNQDMKEQRIMKKLNDVVQQFLYIQPDQYGNLPGLPVLGADSKTHSKLICRSRERNDGQFEALIMDIDLHKSSKRGQPVGDEKGQRSSFLSCLWNFMSLSYVTGNNYAEYVLEFYKKDEYTAEMKPGSDFSSSKTHSKRHHENTALVHENNALSFRSRILIERTDPKLISSDRPWNARITMDRLGKGENNKDKELLIVAVKPHQYGQDEIGFLKISVNDLVRSVHQGRREFCLVDNRGYDTNYCIHFQKANLVVNFTFMDYIKCGMRTDFGVAVDFTSSSAYLHGYQCSSSGCYQPHISTPMGYKYHIRQGLDNQYESAIRAVAKVCAQFNEEEVYTPSGFGAYFPDPASEREFNAEQRVELHGDRRGSQFFHLHSGPNGHTVEGVEGIVSAYRNISHRITLDTPTNFASTINHFAQIARKIEQNIKDCVARGETPKLRYLTLLIITDGTLEPVNTAVPETKRAIIEASALPMSIVIIGVGNGNFSQMVVLDSDDGPLTDSIVDPYSGQKRISTAVRDIVQFVDIKEHIPPGKPLDEWSKAEFAAKLWEEVPGQVEWYMNNSGVKVSEEYHKKYDPTIIYTAGTSYHHCQQQVTPGILEQSASAPPYPAVWSEQYSSAGPNISRPD